VIGLWVITKGYFLGTLNMIKTGYMHFMVEHVHGHHRNVATPMDPASARKGETVYGFIPRSVIGGFRSAYGINPRFVTLSVMASSVFLLMLYKLFGGYVLAMHILASLGAISYL
jgi:phage shock protein PspC (stress-responsive transcriptional regulator)